MKKNKLKDKIPKLIMYCIIAILVGATVLICVLFCVSLMKKLHTDNTSYLMDLSRCMAVNIDEKIDFCWNTAESFGNRLEGLEISNESELKEIMGAEEIIYGQEGIQLIVFDNELNYYDSEGIKGALNGNEFSFVEASKEREIVMKRSGGGNAAGADNEQLFFMVRLDNPLTFDDGTSISSAGVAGGYSIISGALTSASFNERGETFIINKDGGTLFYEQSEHPVLGGVRNVLNQFEKMKYGYDFSYDAIIDNINAKRPASALVSTGGRYCYASFVQLEACDWILVNVMSQEQANHNVDEFMNMALLGMTGISLIVATVVSLAVFFGLSYSVSSDIANREIKNNVALHEAAKKSEAANRAKTVFFSHMSHDIRTPINGIMGMTEIAAKNVNDPDKVKECLDKITFTSKHLLSLLNDVLDMSRIESGKLNIENKPFCMNDLISGCYDVVSSQASEKNINVECNFEMPQNLRLIGDELHIRQVIINILGNAVKFTRRGGEIIFSVRTEDIGDDECNATIIVSDNGIGMSREFLDRIFDPFSQESDNGRSEYNGTGLGMAIVKQLLNQMNGTINVESAPGEGSTFTVRIRVEKDTTIDVKKASTSEDIDLSGTRVLLVEDVAMNLEIARYMLEESGITVTSATNGQEAVDIFMNNPPHSFDLILMDVMMPKMSGLEASKIIRASGREDAACIPIIAMTANVYSEDKRAAKAAGMNDHISKPVDMSKLLQLIKGYVA